MPTLSHTHCQVAKKATAQPKPTKDISVQHTQTEEITLGNNVYSLWRVKC